MKIKINTLVKNYVFLAIFYYAGFLNFLTRLMSEPDNNDAFSANAIGSVPRQTIGLLLLVLGIFILSRLNRHVLWESIKKNCWWFILVSYFLISIQWSYEPGITLRRTIAFSTLLVAAFCIAQCLEMKTLFLLIGKAIFCAALLGLIYAVIDPSMGLSNTDNRTNALMGIYANKNGGARVYAYGLLILIGLGKTRTIIDRLMILVLAVCVVIADSATAIVMVIGGLSLMSLFRFLRTKNRHQNLGRIFFIILIIIVTSITVAYLFEYILQLLGRDPTLTNRKIIWELMDKYVDNESMFGYGFGAFWSSDAVAVFVDRWGFIGNAHSGYYEMLLNGGKIGFVILSLIIISIVRSLVTNYISHQHGEIFSMFVSIVIIQIIVNYVAFILINHNSFDMFLFAIISFIGFKEIINNSAKNKLIIN